MPQDFPLGNRIDDPFSVFSLPDDSRPEGTVIIGQNGFGKSSCIYRMVQQDIREGTAAIVIDPKGDLADKLVAAGNEKMILIEVNEDFPFGINPYEVIGNRARNIDRTVNKVVNLFKKVFGDKEFHPNIELVMRPSARMICCNDLTMAEVPYIFGSRAFRNELMKKVQNKQVEHFWAHWDALPPFEKGRLVQPLIARLNAFLEQEWLYRVLSQRHTTIPFDKVFKEGYTLLIKLPREDEELTDFLGAVFVSLLSQYVWKQNEVAEALRPRIHLYIDEYSHFGSSSTTAMFFKEARFLNVGTLASLQILSDIKDVAHREALMNSGSLILFQVTGNDAEELVKNLTVPPEEVKIDPRIFTITRHPFDYLVENNHSHPAVLRFTEKCIRPMKEIIETNYQDQFWLDIDQRLLTNWHRMDKNIEELNNLFLSCMDIPGYIGSDSYYEQVIQFVRFTNTVGHYMQCSNLPEVTSSYIRYRNQTGLERIKDTMRREAGKEWQIFVKNFTDFVDDLQACCQALADDPIRIPTGAIDVKLLSKQVKSFADRKGELSHKLATLPRYTAYVQTHDVSGVPQEGEVKLYAPDFPVENKAKRARITEYSSQFMSSWEEIETEIEERQGIIYDTLQITPPPKKTPDEPETYPLVSRSEIYYPQ